MIVKLLTEPHLEFLSLKGGCRGSSESTLVKMLEISCRGSLCKDKRVSWAIKAHCLSQTLTRLVHVIYSMFDACLAQDPS